MIFEFSKTISPKKVSNSSRHVGIVKRFFADGYGLYTVMIQTSFNFPVTQAYSKVSGLKLRVDDQGGENRKEGAHNF